MSIHGLSVHLHTGILVLGFMLALFTIIIRLLIFLYPRWGLIRGIFTDWDFTKKIWVKRDSIFKAMDYTTLICIAAGVLGLVIGIYTGGDAISWDFSSIVMKGKLVTSIYALELFGIALVIRLLFWNKMWKNAGLIVIYGLTIGFGFLFIFIDGAIGGIYVYGESIAEPLMRWLEEIGFFRLLGLEGLFP